MRQRIWEYEQLQVFAHGVHDGRGFFAKRKRYIGLAFQFEEWIVHQFLGWVTRTPSGDGAADH